MKVLTIAVSLAALSLPFGAHAFDEAAARAVYKSPKNSCAKCHALEKEKDGPSYRKVAEKYKGKADAEEKLLHHITAGVKVTFPDGHEEDHRIIEEKDPEQLKNFVQWILAQ
jgi:cytochrome c